MKGETKRGGRRGLVALLSRRSVSFGLWVGAALVTVIALFFAIANWAGAQGLSEEEARWEERGGFPAVRDLLPAPVPDQENFGALPAFRDIGRAPEGAEEEPADSLGALSLAWPREVMEGRGKPKPPPRTRMGKEVGFRPWVDYLQLEAPAEAGEEEMARLVLAELERSRGELVAALATGIDLPESQPVADYYKGVADHEFLMSLPTPHVFRVLSASEFLQLRGMAAITVGQREVARECVGILCQLARYVGRDFLVGSLVGVSVQGRGLILIGEGLDRHLWTDGDLAWMDGKLQEIAWDEVLQGVLAWEAVAAMQTIDYLRANNGRLPGLPGAIEGDSWRSVALRFYPNGWYDSNKAAVARLYREIQDVPAGSRRLWRQRTIAQRHEAEIEAMRRRPSRIFAAYVVASMPRACEALTKGEIGVSQGRIAVALERHRLRHGSLPARLTELVPDFLSEVPLDPVDGNLMRYRRVAADDWLLWSIGMDEVDDGGKEPGTVLERNKQKGDRVWGDWAR